MSLAVAALTTSAIAQNNAFYWTRTDASVDIELNTVRHALANTANQLVAVGRSPSPNGFRGNITVFNRNRAVMDVALLNPPGGGNLELTKVFEYEDAYLVAGTATPTGSTDQQIYLAIVDRSLNLLDEIMFPANNGAGEEIVTDLVGTSGHRWVCGRAMATNGWRAFAYHLTGLVDNPVLLDNLPLGDDPTPQLTYDSHDFTGMQSITFGCTTTTGPIVRQYNLFNVNMWERDLAQAGGSGYRLILDNVAARDGDTMATISWNVEPTPGAPESRSRVWALRSTDGTNSHTSALLSAAGSNQIVAAGSAYREFGNIVTIQDIPGRSEVRSLLDMSLTQSGTWTSPQLNGRSHGIYMDSFGESLALRTFGTWMYAAKLNVGTVKRFDMYLPTTLNANQLEAGAVLNSRTGDIFIYGSDDHHMEINCYQQAPIAITDQYVARRGIFFRPTAPVTNNDKYAVSTTIFVIDPPDHGIMTMGADGFFNYTAFNTYTGPDSFRYQLVRPGFPPSTATVNINVTN